MSYTTTIVDTETGAPIDESLYTPYACAKVVNGQLEELGRPAGLPPQMFYNYIRQGMLATVVVDGKKLVRESVLATWLVGYLERKDKAAAKKMTSAASK
jgi:hypothetical protein